MPPDDTSYQQLPASYHHFTNILPVISYTIIFIAGQVSPSGASRVTSSSAIRQSDGAMGVRWLALRRQRQPEMWPCLAPAVLFPFGFPEANLKLVCAGVSRFSLSFFWAAGTIACFRETPALTWLPVNMFYCHP